MKPFLNTILFLMLSLSFIPLKASHIIGGELTYTCTGPETYEIKLILYRDCYTGVPDFDDPAYISVFNAATNEFITNFELYSPVIEEVPIIFAWYDTVPDICVERAT